MWTENRDTTGRWEPIPAKRGMGVRATRRPCPPRRRRPHASRNHRGTVRSVHNSHLRHPSCQYVAHHLSRTTHHNILWLTTFQGIP